MKLSPVIPFAVLTLLAAGPVARAEKSFNFEQSRASSSDDWCRDSEGSRDREHFCEVRTMTMAAPSMLAVETSNGSIAVTGSARRDITMQVKVVAQADTSSEAKSIVADVTILTEGGHVQAEGPKVSGRRGWWVSYRIESPTRQDVDLGTSNGSVTLTGLAGTLRADTSNGSVHATDLSGDVKLSTSNGSLQVVLGGSAWSGAGLDATTSNGSLRVEMPRDYSAHLDARTGNGSLNIDRPVTITGRMGRELVTDLGKGGAPLRLRTSNSSLKITQR